MESQISSGTDAIQTSKTGAKVAFRRTCCAVPTQTVGKFVAVVQLSTSRNLTNLHGVHSFNVPQTQRSFLCSFWGYLTGKKSEDWPRCDCGVAESNPFLVRHQAD